MANYECVSSLIPPGVIITAQGRVITAGSEDGGKSAAMLLRRLAEKLDRLRKRGGCDICGDAVIFSGDKLCDECMNVGQEAGSQ